MNTLQIISLVIGIIASIATILSSIVGITNQVANGRSAYFVGIPLILLASLFPATIIWIFVKPKNREVDFDQVTIILILIAYLISVLIFGLAAYSDKSPVRASDPPNNSNVNIITNNQDKNTNINIIIIQIQQNLEKGIDEPNYSIKRHPNGEVIEGQKGDYYIIDLKDVDTKEPILFDLGKYTKDEFERAFRNSMLKVKTDILDYLATGNTGYKLYVKGSADVLGSKKSFVAELIEKEPLEVTYLKQKPNNRNQFLQEYGFQTIPTKYKNEHLPNLRAVYIQNRLKDMNENSTILEGYVTERESKEDRNALILLYLPKLKEKVIQE